MKVHRPIEERDTAFGIAGVVVDGRQVDEGPSRSVLLPILEKDGQRSAKEPESFVEAPLTPPQGSLEVEQDGTLQGVSSPFLKVRMGRRERCIRTLQIRSYPAGISNVSPGTGSQISISSPP